MKIQVVRELAAILDVESNRLSNLYRHVRGINLEFLQVDIQSKRRWRGGRRRGSHRSWRRRWRRSCRRCRWLNNCGCSYRRRGRGSLRPTRYDKRKYYGHQRNSKIKSSQFFPLILFVILNIVPCNDSNIKCSFVGFFIDSVLKGCVFCYNKSESNAGT